MWVGLLLHAGGGLRAELYGTGIRLGECARINLDDLDLSSGQLLASNGQGRKDRVEPVPKMALAALGLFLHEVRRGFVHDESEPAPFLSKSGLRLALPARRG